MARKATRSLPTVLGVHFSTDSIHVVEMRRQGNGAAVTAFGAVNLRRGYLDEGTGGGARTVGAKLRVLLREIGATSKSAYVSVPGAYTIVRTFSFPPMPDPELRVVVDGELRHQKLLTESGGAFDFVQIGDVNPDGEVSVLTVAADDLVLWLITDIMKEAGLHIVSHVPEHTALLRAAVEKRGISAPTLFLTVSDGSCEMAVVSTEGVLLYRKLDARGVDLVQHTVAADDPGETEDSSGVILEAKRPKAQSATGLDPLVTERLLTDVRRSLEFLRRSRAEEAAIGEVVLATTSPKWDAFAKAVEDNLGIPCSTATPASEFSGLAVEQRASGRDTSRIMCPVGLALHNFRAPDDSVPAFRLVPAVRTTAKMQRAGSGVRPALITSGVFAVLAVSAWIVFAVQAARLSQANEQLDAEYANLEQSYLPQQQALKTEVAAIAELATEGIPFGPILDEVSLSLDPGIGLEVSRFDVGGMVVLEGQAESEEAIVNTLNRLREIGGFVSTYVNSFENRDGRGLTFSISSQFDLTFPAAQSLASGAASASPSTPILPAAQGGDQ